jgi:hypothetical protein
MKAGAREQTISEQIIKRFLRSDAPITGLPGGDQNQVDASARWRPLLKLVYLGFPGSCRF